MRDYNKALSERVAWIQQILADSGAKGVIFGNSGGKDSALAGILCRKATANVLGVAMPCGSKQNYESDTDHAQLLAEQFDIKMAAVDLTGVRDSLLSQLNHAAAITQQAQININPRLRMTALYALGQSLGYLVAGTGNKSENYMGYFTKWGDGACDFNPIADLYAHEVTAFLKHLDAPKAIVEKAPSAGLFDGQTDEADMGVTYHDIHTFIETGTAPPGAADIIRRAHAATAHKRRPPKLYGSP